MVKPLKRIIIIAAIVSIALVVFVAFRLTIAHHNVSKISGETQRFAEKANAALVSPMPPGIGDSKSRLSNVTAVPDIDISKVAMPAPGTPLVGIANALKNMSDAGDAGSSCRLAQELTRCRYVDGLPKRRLSLAAKRDSTQPNSEEYERLSQAIETIAARERQEASVCDGFANTDSLEIWIYLFRAAAAGHEPSMLHFATVPPIDLNVLATQPEAALAYYEHSDRFLQQLAERGNKVALMMSINKYMGKSFWRDIGLPFGPTADFQQAAVFAYATRAHNWQREFIDDKIASIESKLTPMQIANAKAEANRLIANWSKDVFEQATTESTDDRFGRCE